MAATSVIRIEELTGKRRVVELKGSGLPKQGVEWGGLTTIATQWNAGNPEATQHVLGPQEMPTTMTGIWRTTQLARTPASFSEGAGTQSVVFAYSLATILDQIRRDGQLLRVTWFNRITGPADSPARFDRQLKIVRVGRLEEFVPKYDRLDDVEWDATFNWLGRGEPPAKLVDDAEDVIAKLRAANIAASEAASKIISQEIFGARETRLFPNQFTIGQLESLVDAPRQLVDDFARSANGITNRLKRLGDLVIKIKETPAAILGRLLDVANNAVAVSNQFIDEVSREGPETITTRNKVSSLTQSAGYYADAQTEAELVRNASNDLARSVRRRRNATDVASSVAGGSDVSTSDILAIYIPKQGDTFVSIAIRFYGSETYGTVLARTNGYPGYTITPPRRRPVVVPSLKVIEAQAATRV